MKKQNLRRKDKVVQKIAFCNTHALAVLTSLRVWKTHNLTQLQTKRFVDARGKPVKVLNLIGDAERDFKEIREVAYRLMNNPEENPQDQALAKEDLVILGAKLSQVRGFIDSLEGVLQNDIGQDEYILRYFQETFLPQFEGLETAFTTL
jgi:hypothetical protein